MIVCGDARSLPLRDATVRCVVTSPPYWGLRDYGIGSDQLGLEPTPDLYIQHLVEIFREVKRVLRDDGTVWLNLGDSYAGSWGNYHPNSPPGKHGQRLKETARWNRPAYADQAMLPPTANAARKGGGGTLGLKPKDLVGIPWRVAFALQADGWYLRSDIIWAKPNPMPESVTDRPTRSHEYVFLLSKSGRYYYDAKAIAEPTLPESLVRYKYDFTGDPTTSGKLSTQAPRGARIAHPTKNRRSVWFIPTQPYRGAHFATFPEKLVEPCVLAGCPGGGTVLDPFCGSGTVGVVAARHGRKFVGVELKPDYIRLAQERIG